MLGILLFVLFGGGCALCQSSTRSSASYRVAVAFGECHRDIIADLGEPIEDGVLMWGFASTGRKARGPDYFSIPLTGPKGSGRLRIHVGLRGGPVEDAEWEFRGNTKFLSVSPDALRAPY